ncbi:MAG: hypothetical protein ACOCQL_02425 [Halolamina sp.]
MSHSFILDRRTLWKLTSAGAVGSIAGCRGGNGDGGGAGREEAVTGLNLGEGWQARRNGPADH